MIQFSIPDAYFVLRVRGRMLIQERALIYLILPKPFFTCPVFRKLKPRLWFRIF